MITLEWKDVRNWEDLYEVSSEGDVRNKRSGKLIVGDVNSAGYHRVCLYDKSHTPPKQRFFRHRLVAEHFIPNPNNLPEVNHKNRDKSKNVKKNLEWVSRSENEIHYRKTSNNPSKRYTPVNVVFEDGHHITCDTVPEVARLMGVTKHAVVLWIRNESKGYIKHGIKSISYINQS